MATDHHQSTLPEVSGDGRCNTIAGPRYDVIILSARSYRVLFCDAAFNVHKCLKEMENQFWRKAFHREHDKVVKLRIENSKLRKKIREITTVNGKRAKERQTRYTTRSLAAKQQLPTKTNGFKRKRAAMEDEPETMRGGVAAGNVEAHDDVNHLAEVKDHTGLIEVTNDDLNKAPGGNEDPRDAFAKCNQTHEDSSEDEQDPAASDATTSDELMDKVVNEVAGEEAHEVAMEVVEEVAKMRVYKVAKKVAIDVITEVINEMANEVATEARMEAGNRVAKKMALEVSYEVVTELAHEVATEVAMEVDNKVVEEMVSEVANEMPYAATSTTPQRRLDQEEDEAPQNIYVELRGISKRTKIQDLKDFFLPTIVEIQLIGKRHSGRARAVFKNQEEALKALQMNGRTLHDRFIELWIEPRVSFRYTSTPVPPVGTFATSKAKQFKAVMETAFQSVKIAFKDVESLLSEESKDQEDSLFMQTAVSHISD